MLFENSIVCHVFYAMDALWLGLFVGLFVACLFCFGLPGSLCCGGWVGPGLVFWTVVLTLGSGWLCVVGWGLVLLVLFGEFDPGSGRTLAACLTHASRTVKGPAFVGPG